jgi:multiple sugar transport system substrate-binding protein
MKRFSIRRVGGTVTGATLALGLLTCVGSASAADKTTISVAYGSTYVFDTDDFAKQWWNGIKEQFEKAHPDAEVQLVPIPGSYDDIVNKQSLLYRSASTAPDVAMIATPVIGQFASSDYLLPLDDYLTSEDWWKQFPDNIKNEGVLKGKTYAVSTGENDSQLYYNKDMFKKAGLPVPWTPKTWDEILAAARTIKAKVPDVTPLFLLAGTSSGDNGILQGAGNLLAGSSVPTILDEKTGKYVVDSAGLREVFGFYHSVYSEKLGASLSDLFSPSAVTIPLDQLAKGKVAIVFGSNYYGGNWTKLIASPAWPEAPQVAGVVPIPTIHGQAPGIASTLGGWDFAVSAKTKNPKLAWELVKLMESDKNQIDAANWAGFVPANQQTVKNPDFVNFAPPFNEVSAQVLPYAKLSPATADYLVWSHGFQAATGELAQHPETTVDGAVDVMKSYVTDQLGEQAVETLK